MSSTYEGQYDDPPFNRLYRDPSMYPPVEPEPEEPVVPVKPGIGTAIIGIDFVVD